MAFDIEFYWPIALECFWFFTILAITLVTLISMRHIRRSSEALENIGIHNNSWQMIIYVTCWGIIAFISPSMTALSLGMNNMMKINEYALEHKFLLMRMAVVMYVFFFLIFLLLNVLDLLILSTYLRYCDELQPGMA